jgi:hypothetical protein
MEPASKLVISLKLFVLSYLSVWAGILENWERVEGKLERVERLMR